MDGLGEVLPRKADRIVFEIVAEGEVAEHLEERMVPGGIADVLKIVVLASRADTFLRRGGAAIRARLFAQEDRFELHHAGVGEQQCGIGLGNQRRARDGGVPMALEVVEEPLSQLVSGWHVTRPAPLVRARGCRSSRLKSRAPQGAWLAVDPRVAPRDSGSAGI